MYFITAMNSILNEETNFASEEAKAHSSRCFGYYHEKADAEKALELNSCDMHETVYDYAVIEEIGEGIHPMADIVGWFKYNSEKDSYEPFEMGRTGFCNYALG